MFAAYANYDDIEEADLPINEDDIREHLAAAKQYLMDMQEANGCIKGYAGTIAAFYTLWAAFVLHREALGEARAFATVFVDFRQKVQELESAADRPAILQGPDGLRYRRASEFLDGYRGASTGLGARTKPLEALLAFVSGEWGMKKNQFLRTLY